jgi:hypothetical protein
MVETDWKSYSEVDPKRDYLAFILMGERKSRLSLLSWIKPSQKVMKQLETTKGLIGYASRLGFWSREAIMVAVFESKNALDEFSHAGQHAQCMEKTKTDAKEGMKSATWSISGSNIPLKLDDAIKRLQSQNDINLINH